MQFFVAFILRLYKSKNMSSDKKEKKLLEKKKGKLIASLPPFGEMMRGSVIERKITCGKPKCRCSRGERHPVVYLSVTVAVGKTIQITVPKELVGTVRRLVNNYARYWTVLEEISEINRELLRKRLLGSD